MFMFLHQLSANVESVQSITYLTRSPRALFTMKASSVLNNIADNSFLGIVASISLDLEARSTHDHSPDFSLPPA